MKKGQASLEYLIIIGAVIAVAAVVILFISNISTSGQQQTGLAACRTAAAQCNNAKATYGQNYDCTDMCSRGCIDPASGGDVLDTQLVGAAQACVQGAGGGCEKCMAADVSGIHP